MLSLTFRLTIDQERFRKCQWLQLVVYPFGDHIDDCCQGRRLPTDVVSRISLCNFPDVYPHKCEDYADCIGAPYVRYILNIYREIRVRCCMLDYESTYREIYCLLPE